MYICQNTQIILKKKKKNSIIKKYEYALYISQNHQTLQEEKR